MPPRALRTLAANGQSSHEDPGRRRPDRSPEAAVCGCGTGWCRHASMRCAQSSADAPSAKQPARHWRPRDANLRARLRRIDRTQVAVVGGKGAHLGELSRIEGISVPAGFCVTTDAFRRVMADAPSIDDRLDRLSRLNPDDRESIRTLSAEIRRTIEAIALPDDRGGGDQRRARPARRASRLRRPIQRDGGGPADGILRRPAGHVPEHRGAGGDPPARQPVLGLALHRASRDLPPAERLRPPRGPHGRGRAADDLPGRLRHPVHC